MNNQGKNNKSIFIQALARFSREVASDGAIRHLADRGYNAKQIKEKLDYPTSLDHIGKVMWEHFLQKGILTYEKPDGNTIVEEVQYIKEQDSYGRTSFRQVTKKIERPKREYILIDFGKRIYKDREGFLRIMERLSTSDRDYIMGLPWELKPVYHVLDKRMMRIKEILGKEFLQKDEDS
ncbi:hypothetical protein [Lachnospira multipara]|uniref:hypothetical protein n=1 Tax=Lachnospira multipara TaxID=28051 RepID=UPI0004E0C6B1|nr:hypothetical protein [Lachnospira multipara]